ncbi:MAG: DUF1573 domain-containing protein [Firmicutes bacterium]|nr:DUF1573 domain-containing protein [Bacillota bacterium]MCM1400983.1 DUF1573 domain-containing protein [Bacteroides sp.]MCM1476506.1 DUF1573 domain-containing protein [Bacteroides sp.]
MKRLAVILVSLMAAAGLWAQPRLYWLNTVHDFGAFKEDLAKVYCTFKAVNTGTEPVTVLSARANCGCTQPTYPRTPVMPGDTLTISVAYDAVGRPGRFTKQVRVETTSATVNLVLKGTVIGSPSTLAARFPIEAGNARLSNSLTPFGQTRKGRVLSAAVNIYNPTDHPMRPAVDSLPSYVNALFRPEVIAPGDQGTLSLTAYTDRCPDYGLLTDRFIIIPDSENNPQGRASVATTIIVNEDFTNLTPEERDRAAKAQPSTGLVEFGRLVPGNKKVEREFTITNAGHKQLIIRRLFTADPALTLKLKSTKVAPGKSTTVKVVANCADLKAGQPLNARITLITNSPSAPTQIVRVTGEVYEK